MERDSKKRIETPPKGDEAVYCAVPRCKNVGGIRSKSSGITFHPFPVNDPQRMKAWGEAIHKRGFHPTDQSKICSTHFEPHCFDHSQPNVTLTADAMPTIFNTPLFSHSATRRKKARNKPRRSDYSAAGGIIEARIKEELDEDDDDVGQPDDEPTANDSLLAPALPDLRQKLLQFQKDGYLCDTTLMADDGEVKVHGVVLAATSTKFKASLDSQEGTVGHIISVPGVELYLLNIAVHFAYTGDIVVPKKNFSLNELPHVINVLLDLGFTIPTKNSSTSGASAMPTIECSFNASSRDGEPKLIAIDQVKLDGFDPENGDELVAFGDEENSTDTVLLTEIGNEAQDNESDLRQQHQLEEEEEADGDETSADVAGEQRAAGEPRVPNHKHCSLLCVTCGKLCSTSVKLLNHMRTHYGERNPYVCDDCGRHFSLPETLRRHRKLHSGIRPHLCQHCGKGFIRRGNLKDHVLLFHPELAGTEVEMYSCPHCHEQFPTYAKLVHHRRHYCGGQSVSGAPSTSTSSSSSSHKRRTSSSKRSTQFDCQTCGLLCPSNVAFAGHYQLHTGRSTHACAVCLAEFDDNASLSEHYFKHASDLPFFCVVCGRAFSLQALLNAHQKMHDASRPHMCRTCGKRFRMRASLTNHELVHSGEKPYVCSICDMRFRESNHVRRHLRVHTGERPYPCNLCEKTYKTRNDLRIHSRRIHQVEIPPKYGANYRSENSTGSMQGNAAFENTLVVNC